MQIASSDLILKEAAKQPSRRMGRPPIDLRALMVRDALAALLTMR
jgi:hypothetical protein